MKVYTKRKDISNKIGWKKKYIPISLLFMGKS